MHYGLIIYSTTLLTMHVTSSVILLLAFLYTKKYISIVNKCKDIKTE